MVMRVGKLTWYGVVMVARGIRSKIVSGDDSGVNQNARRLWMGLDGVG